MKHQAWLIAMVLGIASAQSGASYAANPEVVVKAENASDFSAVVAAVEKQMAPGGHYEFVTAPERSDIDARFKKMQAVFAKYGTIAQMDQQAKVQLFNDQEAVNAILTHRNDTRQICENVAPMGSIIPRTTCQTYRQKEEARRSAQRFIDSKRQIPQFKQGG
ncbi:MAG TPA: hypothetical protein VLZ55_05885 [Rhodanobacter sp.]|nr:hypothetical protein [Rhodanobacter sp.]